MQLANKVEKKRMMQRKSKLKRAKEKIEDLMRTIVQNMERKYGGRRKKAVEKDYKKEIYVGIKVIKYEDNRTWK